MGALSRLSNAGQSNRAQAREAVGLQGLALDLFGTLALPPDVSSIAALAGGRGHSCKAIEYASSGFPAALLVDEMGLNLERSAAACLTGSYPDAQSFIEHLQSAFPEAGAVRPETLSLVDELTTFAIDNTVLAPRCHDVLEQWRRSGHALQLVSDVSLPFSRAISKLGLSEWFADPILSHQSGCLKGGGAAFRQLDPQRQWTVIGDSWRSDVLGGLTEDRDVIFVDATACHFARDLLRDVRPLLELAKDNGRIRIATPFREVLFNVLPIAICDIEDDPEAQLILQGDGAIGFRCFERVTIIEQIADLCQG